MSSIEKDLYKRQHVGKKRVLAPKSRFYRGTSTINKENSSFVLYDLALIKQDLINHFHIRQGEKLENPEFGTIIWDVLFEPLTENLKQAIQTDVTRIVIYDPRVQVESIVIDSFESGIRIECELFYIPYNISEKLQFTFDQNNGFIS